MGRDPLREILPPKPHSEERRRRLVQLLNKAQAENLQIIADTRTGGNPLLAKDESDRKDLLTKHRLVVERLNVLLAQIDNYGHCEICGDPIEIERLEEYWARRTCSRCDKQIDHRVKSHIAQAIERGHLA